MSITTINVPKDTKFSVAFVVNWKNDPSTMKEDVLGEFESIVNKAFMKRRAALELGIERSNDIKTISGNVPKINVNVVQTENANMSTKVKKYRVIVPKACLSKDDHTTICILKGDDLNKYESMMMDKIRNRMFEIEGEKNQ